MIALLDQNWGLITFLCILLPFSIVSILFEFIERFDLFSHFKLQNNTSEKKFYDVAIYWVSVNLLIIGISCYFAEPILRFLFQSTITSPNVFTFFWQILIFFISEDICFYFYHRIFHSIPWLYRYHKIHHTFTAPYPFCSYAIHPVELMCQSLGSIFLPVFIRPHVYVWWTYLILRTFQGSVDHLGYEFLPSFLANTTIHGLHHSINTGNYASLFHTIDILLGTNISVENDVKLE